MSATDRDGWVVGCVYGAYQALVQKLGDAAPTYQWCEDHWLTIRSTAPAPACVPDWLFSALFFAWRRANPIPREPHQPQLPLWSRAAQRGH